MTLCVCARIPLRAQKWSNTHNFLLDMPTTSNPLKPGNLSFPQGQIPPVSSTDTDILMRIAAFKRIDMLSKMHGHLTHRELSTGFRFQRERIPLVNPQRGHLKRRKMRDPAFHQAPFSSQRVRATLLSWHQLRERTIRGMDN